MFTKRPRMDVLQKTQENLDVTQKNLEVLSTTLEKMADKNLEPGISVYTDSEKRKAAYALNLCMISVSQIIDYNNIYILEQEYEAILNNLNLEVMPKDEALLNILKQLMDTINFFRIQEVDKEFLEKEYQQKMKNAIWSAVPNIGILVAGGSWETMAISLVTQVGIGYMNYRKTKAQTLLEKEKAEWQIQRSAIEQFHGLRRELFDTAWRLADKYNFSDKYRITEKQITRYNEILLDSDYSRRYERLEYMQDNFVAYPPYWYYLGNAANMISQDEINDENTKAKYRELASNHFRNFINQTEHNLLREDQLLASCALEYFDLLLLEGKNDKSMLEGLLNRAIDAAGNAYDVLELCAFSYLKINEYPKAAKILRMLVNEDYNATVNAQFLSNIYVFDIICNGKNDSKADYLTLRNRVDSRLLFPLPETRTDSKTDMKKLQTEFLHLQKVLLLEKYAVAIKEILTRYTVAFNQSIPAPEIKQGIPDFYYYDNAEARQNRKKIIRKVFESHSQINGYLHRLDSFVNDILNSLNGLFSAVREFPGISSADAIGDCIEEQIRNKGKELSELQEKIHRRDFNAEDVDNLFAYSFSAFTKDGLNMLIDEIKKHIFSIKGMEGVSLAESGLRRFCVSQNLPISKATTLVDELPDEQNRVRDIRFDIRSLSMMDEEQTKEYTKNLKMLSNIKKYIGDLLITNSKKIELYAKGEYNFNAYIERHHKDMDKGKILAVINDTSHIDEDWLLRSDGIQRYYRVALFKFKKDPVAYRQIKTSNKRKTTIMVDKDELNDDRIDINKLYQLISELSQIESDFENSPKVLDNFHDAINLPEHLPIILLEDSLSGCGFTEQNEQICNEVE